MNRRKSSHLHVLCWHRPDIFIVGVEGLKEDPIQSTIRMVIVGVALLVWDTRVAAHAAVGRQS